MSTLLVCTDGSAFTPSLYDHAAWAAQRLDAAIHVLHALDPHHEQAAIVDYSGSIGVDAQAALMNDLVTAEQSRARAAQTRGRAVLASAVQYLEKLAVTRVHADQRHGSLLDTLSEFETGAELVLLGKRGESADRDPHHLGSNLERVVRSVHHPVLVTPATHVAVERVLLAYDGSPSATKALEFAATSPLLKNLPIHILRTGRVDDNARWFLGEAAEKLTKAGRKVTHHVLPGHPETVIEQLIDQEKIQLLLMGAYGHSRIRQLIVGSTTTAIIRTARVPVLLFR